MRIGIDVGVLREKVRGVGHYLINILERFPRFAKNDEFFLYSSQPIIYKFSDVNIWYKRNGTIPLPGAFWLQTQGKSYIKKDKIEIFFAPAHILPLNLPKSVRKILAVNDLVSILYPETMANYNRFVHNLFFKKSIKNTEYIITMSEYTKQSIIDYFAIDKRKISVIYGGVSRKFRKYPKDEVEEVLKRYKLERPYILSVGTLEPRKNYPVLLDAFKNLKTGYDLVIIGKQGWKSKSIINLIHNLQLENRVKILGYIEINDLPYLYNGATVFVFPSIYEGFGLPLVEAMACGVPVVCSNASCLPEIGSDAIIYFNPQLVDELIIKIQQVIDDTQLQKSLSDKSIVQAKKFNWDNTAQKTLAVLKGQ